MADYAILFTKSARKELEKLEDKFINSVILKIEKLGYLSRPSGCKKIIGRKNLWRIRVGDYRVVYTINDNENKIDIIAIRHRKDIYQ